MTSLEEELAGAAPSRETYLTVGVFDGVHRGHRHLLGLLKDEAARAGCTAGVVTFRNHPVTVLNPALSLGMLTTVEERVLLLRELGLEPVIPITFTREVSQLKAGQFVALLQQHLRMRGMVVGPDFAMGHNREGTPEVLRALGKDHGFSVKVAAPYDYGGIRASSTAIRNALALGDLPMASQLLGRDFSITGEVVHGSGRGASVLGYPTANIAVNSNQCLPADGVYATWIYLGRQQYAAATSVGVRPTFGPGERTVEAFVLDFQGDLYQKRVRLEFAGRLRGEIAFDTVEALRRQMGLDVEETRQILRATA